MTFLEQAAIVYFNTYAVVIRQQHVHGERGHLIFSSDLPGWKDYETAQANLNAEAMKFAAHFLEAEASQAGGGTKIGPEDLE